MVVMIKYVKISIIADYTLNPTLNPLKTDDDTTNHSILPTERPIYPNEVKLGVI